jgi:hypothetical protein
MFAGLVFETSAIMSLKLDQDNETVFEMIVDSLQDALVQRGVTYDVEGQGRITYFCYLSI